MIKEIFRTLVFVKCFFDLQIVLRIVFGEVYGWKQNASLTFLLYIAVNQMAHYIIFFLLRKIN